MAFVATAKPDKPVTGELVLAAPPPGRIAAAMGVKVAPEMGGIANIRVTRYGSRAHDPKFSVASIEYRISFGDLITIAAREPLDVDTIVRAALGEWKRQAAADLRRAGSFGAQGLFGAEWIGALAADTWKRLLNAAKERFAQTGGYEQTDLVPLPSE